jgi:hypothetical protein
MTINKEVINQIAEKNSTSEAFFSYLNTRERSIRKNESSVPWIQHHMHAKGYQYEPQELLSTLKELERIGALELKGDKVTWKTSVRELAAPVKIEKPLKSAKQETQTMVICFDKERQFYANYPSKLSKEEVDLVYKLLAQSLK